MIVNLSGDNPMNDRYLQAKSQVTEAVRASLTVKAAMLGVPLAIACNAFIPPAAAQDEAAPDQVSRNTDDSSDEALEEIIVRGKVTLRHREAFSATKMNMDLKDIAQSVTVVTRDLIDVSGIQKFQDLYRVDASVGTSHRLDDFPTNFFRGFYIQGNNAVRVDGFRFPGNVELDLATFERFELVKGPTSALFGQNSLGGTINAVTKQPTSERVGEIGLEVGSFDSYRADIDLGGALSSDGRWQYRLIGVYRDSDTYIDFASDKAWVVAPSIAFDLSDQTRIVAALNIQDHDDNQHWGTGLQLFAPGEYRALPTSRGHNFGQAWNQRNVDVVLGTIKLDHEFDNGWELRVNVQSSSVDKVTDQCSGDGHPDATGVLQQGCWTYFADGFDDLYGGEVNLIGDVSIGGREHTLFFGVDYSIADEENRFGWDYIDDNGDGIAAGRPAGFRLTPEPSAVHSTFDRENLYYVYDHIFETQYAGVTLQALLNPTDRLQVLLSGRFTFDEAIVRSGRGIGFGPGSLTLAELDNAPYNRQPAREISTEEFIPQIGVTYAVTDNVNVYLNWGETYNPDTSFQQVLDPNNPNAGLPLPPEEGEQIEIGLKADILDDQASITAAIFDMDRTGISEPDRNNPGFRIPSGSQNVKGVEFSLSGDVTEAFNIYWSVAYLDAEFTGASDFGGGGTAPAGARPVNTPRFASSFFANYAILGGTLEGLGLGLGWVYKDMYNGWGRISGGGGDAANGIHFDQGDVNEVDFRIHYDTDNWKYYLSVFDVFDDLYYSAARQNWRWGVAVNPGRRFQAGVKYRF